MKNTFEDNPAAISVVSAISLLALGLILVGCGGESGTTLGTTPIDPPTPPPVSVNAAALQGRWATASSAPTGFGMLVLPAQDGITTAWLLAQDASTLTRLSVMGGTAFAVAGKSYSFNASGAQTVASVSASAQAALTATPKSLTLNGLGQAPVALLQSDAFTAPASQADLVANWRASVSQGAQVIDWQVDTAGVVTGTSSTSCTWRGSLAALPSATGYRASLTETCAAGAVQFSGLATISPAKTQLTIVAASTDETKGIVLLMTKR